MTTRSSLCAKALALIFSTAVAAPILGADDSTPEKGVAVQPRGQIHEAFAKPVAPNAEAGPAVPKKPPEPIPELPPDVRPRDEDAKWIPGYWAWDADRKDFVWISGTWRVPPPDRKWTPGYWTKADRGWRWVHGFWVSVNQDGVDYLNAPPESLDNGPSVDASDENNIYVPGSWVPQRGRYYWRPGFWNDTYRDWVWVPAHYEWTPAGYVFIEGYWDYVLEDRGMLFPPVYFDEPLWTTPGWCYRPRFAVGLGGLFNSWWVGPGYGCYYYGDYYGGLYAGWGFTPWCFFGPRFYDPLFCYYRWQNRGNPQWHQNLNNTFQARQSGNLTRPPRTLTQQNALVRVNQANAGTASNLRMVTPVNQLSRDTVQVNTLSVSQLKAQTAAVQSFRDFSTTRSSFERTAATHFADSGVRSSADGNWKAATDGRSRTIVSGSGSAFQGGSSSSTGSRLGVASGAGSSMVGGSGSSGARISPSPSGGFSGRGSSGSFSGGSRGGFSGGGSRGGSSGGGSRGGGGGGGGRGGGGGHR